MESWRSHFFKLLNSDIHDDHSVDPPTDDVNTVQDELLDSEITEDEVRKAIWRLKSGKAAGTDQVINQFLKSTERVILPFLVKLCNAIFNQGIFPEEWTKSIIVPQHKKGDCDNPDNYRGISLLSSLSKDLQNGQKKTLYSQKLKQASGKVIRQQTTYLLCMLLPRNNFREMRNFMWLLCIFIKRLIR